MRRRIALIPVLALCLAPSASACSAQDLQADALARYAGAVLRDGELPGLTVGVPSPAHWSKGFAIDGTPLAECGYDQAWVIGAHGGSVRMARMDSAAEARRAILLLILEVFAPPQEPAWDLEIPCPGDQCWPKPGLPQGVLLQVGPWSFDVSGASGKDQPTGSLETQDDIERVLAVAQLLADKAHALPSEEPVPKVKPALAALEGVALGGCATALIGAGAPMPPEGLSLAETGVMSWSQGLAAKGTQPEDPALVLCFAGLEREVDEMVIVCRDFGSREQAVAASETIATKGLIPFEDVVAWGQMSQKPECAAETCWLGGALPFVKVLIQQGSVVVVIRDQVGQISRTDPHRSVPLANRIARRLAEPPYQNPQWDHQR